MTVNNSANKVIAAGNGVQTVFAFGFIAVAASNISVIVTDNLGNETTLSTAQYSISLNAAGTGQLWSVGGAVTYPLSGSPIATGWTLTILRELSLTQLVSLSNQGNQFPSAVESALDVLEMQIQQLSELFNRAISVPVVDINAPLPLPPVAQRANLARAFDSNGNPIAAALPSSGIISSAMQPVVDAASLAAGRAALGLGALATEGFGAGLQDDGAGNARVSQTIVADATSQPVVAGFHLQRHIATGPITYTLARANTYWNGFGFWIEVPGGGQVTLAINAADSIEGQASGTSGFLSIGSSSFITTDAASAGTWRVQGGFIGISGFLTMVTSGVNGPTLKAGTNAASGDDAAILVTRNLAPASGLLSSHAVRDETIATVDVTGSQFSGYAAFDAAFQVQGTAVTPENHIHGFQARQSWNASGTCNEWAGFTAQATVAGSGSLIANVYGMIVQSPIITSGGITNQYAYYSNPLLGAVNSYFLYQGSPGNPSVLSGGVYLGGATGKFSVEICNVQYNGVSQYGMLFADTNGAAGNGSPLVFWRNNVQVGAITNTLSSTSYTTSSDERLKTFTGRYDPAQAIRIIREDPVRAFIWKSTGEPAIGWGAQKSYAVSADLATPGNDKQPDEPGFLPWGVDQGKRTPYLWAALSAALDRLDAIDAENAFLKKRLEAIEARTAAPPLA